MKVWVQDAYEMYIQGISYPMISDYIGEKETTIRYHIKKYAYASSLPYPRFKPNYKLAYDLHHNGMTVFDVGLYLGVCQQTIRNYIQRYSEMNGIPKHHHHNKPQVAYNLREQGYTYRKISKMLGYQNRSNCYRAIKNYKESLC
jgi:predicted transcriptional regulator